MLLVMFAGHCQFRRITANQSRAFNFADYSVCQIVRGAIQNGDSSLDLAVRIGRQLPAARCFLLLCRDYQIDTTVTISNHPSHTR